MKIIETKNGSFRTEKCIVCLNPSNSYTGHVILGKLTITAGWCATHSPKNSKIPPINLINRIGCYGAWDEAYGLRYEDYNDNN